jgi:hypothetical protein
MLGTRNREEKMKALRWITGQSILSARGDYYKVIQLLGEGKSATAYLALRTGAKEKGTFHVVKLLQHPESLVKLNNFNREKEVISKFDHSSVIFITDDGEYESAGKKYPFIYATSIQAR